MRHLTDKMTKAWNGLTVKEYKELKGLKKENLRDNMTDIELVLNMLVEVTTTTLSKKEQPETFAENRSVAKRGGKFIVKRFVFLFVFQGFCGVVFVNAINWIGMAVAEKENSVAFTQAMYGIESLLQYEQKG